MPFSHETLYAETYPWRVSLIKKGDLIEPLAANLPTAVKRIPHMAKDLKVSKTPRKMYLPLPNSLEFASNAHQNCAV